VTADDSSLSAAGGFWEALGDVDNVNLSENSLNLGFLK